MVGDYRKESKRFKMIVMYTLYRVTFEGLGDRMGQIVVVVLCSYS